MTQKIYILESGEYEQRGVQGVFDTPERAMGSHPGPWVLTYWNHVSSGRGYSKEWSCECTSYCSYEFYESDLNTSGPLGTLHHIVEQRLNDKRGWDYVTINAARAAELV